NLPNTFEKNGETYDALRTSYLILTGQKATALTVASRQIGGVYNNRALIGQNGAETPFEPVPVATQKAALDLLSDHLFAPNAFAAGEELANRLQQVRRGFAHFGNNEDPGLHARALQIQQGVLNHVMHPAVLTRMTDARRYGGAYPVANFMADLTSAVFDADIGGDVNTYRQNLQIEYVNRLIRIAKNQGVPSFPTPTGPTAPVPFDSVARSAALASLMDVKDNVKGARRGNRETKAHRQHILFLIDKFEQE
ncbi:MAG: zinc-dependent metalloprotease, partial [Pseudomonadota bacterium]